MDVNDIEYEARYGWTSQSTWVIIGAAILGAGAALPDIPVLVRIVILIFFWGGGLAFLVKILRLRGQVALRVDARGIAFGAPRKIDVPWQDLEAVVIFPVKSVRYIGLQRRAGAAALPGGPGQVTRALNRALVPGIPGDVVDTSRPVSGWQLDLERMVAAAAAHAPDVLIYDLNQ